MAANITVTQIDSIVTANTIIDVIDVTTTQTNVIISSTTVSDVNLGNVTTPLVSNSNITTSADIFANNITATNNITAQTFIGNLIGSVDFTGNLDTDFSVNSGNVSADNRVVLSSPAGEHSFSGNLTTLQTDRTNLYSDITEVSGNLQFGNQNIKRNTSTLGLDITPIAGGLANISLYPYSNGSIISEPLSGKSPNPSFRMKSSQNTSDMGNVALDMKDFYFGQNSTAGNSAIQFKQVVGHAASNILLNNPDENVNSAYLHIKNGSGSGSQIIRAGFETLHLEGNTVSTVHANSNVRINGGLYVSGPLTGSFYNSGDFNNDFSSKTTDDLTEGSTNLYFNGKTTDDLTQGSTNKYYANSLVLDYINNNGFTIGGTTNVSGDLNVTGTITGTYNVSNTTSDIFELRKNQPGNADAQFRVVTDGSDATLIWRSSPSRWYQGTVSNYYIIPIDTSELPENGNLYYTDARVNTFLTTTGVTGDVTIQGNLEVNGNIDYVNVEDLLVNDQSITLNYGNASARDAFVYVDRSGSALNNASLQWNETLDQWEIYDGTSTYIVPRSTTDLTEGDNLYYTTARANSAMDAYLTSITANVDSVNGATGVVVLDTDDISEGNTNLYLNGSGTTDDLTEGNTNLYYTDARARAAISSTGNITYDANTGVIGESLTTTDITEGDNLYYTDARARAAISSTGNITYDANTGVIGESLTTTDIDEGDNLYFTTDRANTAIDDYVVGSENIDVASGVISLTNALGNVNSVTSETDTAMVLYGQSQVDLNKTVEGVESQIVDFDTTGYSLQSADLGTANVTSLNVPGLLVQGSATAGTNTMTMIKIIGGFTGSWIGVENGLDAAGAASYNTTGQGGTETDFESVIDNFLTDANKAGWIFFHLATNSTTSVLPANAFVTGISGNTITFSENFTSTVSFGSQFGPSIGFSGIFLPGAFSTTQAIQYALRGDPGTQGGGSTMPYEALSQRMAEYTLPETLSNVTLDAVSYGDPTVDLANVVMRHITDVDVGSAGAIRTDKSLLIGANATPDINSIGVDGILPTATKLGVTIEQDGDTTYGTLEDTPPMNILFNNFANNSLASYTEYPIWTEFSGRSGNANVDMKYLGAPAVSFKQVGGSKSSPSAVTPETVVGRMTWQARSTTAGTINSGNDVFSPPASLTVRVNDANADPLGTVANLDMYLQSTYSTSYRNGANIAGGGIPRTFLASHAGNTVIAAKTDGKIMLKPVRDYGDDASSTSFVENRYAHKLHDYHTFLSAEFANTVTKSGTIVTIQDASGETGGSTDFNYDSSGDATLRLSTHLANGDIKTYWDITNENIGGNLQISQDGTDIVEITGSSVGVNGNIDLSVNSAVNYDRVYGCFHNLANVTAANADTVYAFEFPNVHIDTNRVTIANNTQVTFDVTGAYNFSLEMQAENTDNQDRTAFLWLAKNGTDIAETCVRVSLLKEWKQVIYKEWLVEDIVAGDYVEVRFAVDNTSGIQLTSLPAQVTPYARPVVPSAVLTVSPIGA